MTRIKATALKSREAFEEALNAIATEQTHQRQITAQRDQRIQEIQAEFADDIGSSEDEIKMLLLQCEKFADENRETLFAGGGKTAKTELAAYGYREGNPTLKLLSSRHTWETVKAALKAQGYVNLVKTEETVDKPSTKAQLDDASLAKVGLRIDQKESFWVEPLVEGGAVERAA